MSVKRIVGMALTVVGLVTVSVPMGSTIVSAQDASSTPVIVFDDAAHQAQLIIPTPACPASAPGCQWKFFLNEPKLSIDVGTVYGTSGTLTIAYPADFCGVIQADAYVGPPWVAKRGFQHTIEDCTPPPSGGAASSTTMATVAPTTAAAPVPTAPPEPPGPGSQTSGLPFTAPTDAPTTEALSPPSAAPAGSEPSQLPFTGVNTAPLVAVGLALVLMGLYLLTTTASRRRLLRRVGNCPWPTYGRPRRHF